MVRKGRLGLRARAAALGGSGGLERFPIRLTRKLQGSWPESALDSMFVAFPIGKPVSTFPGDALSLLLLHLRGDNAVRIGNGLPALDLVNILHSLGNLAPDGVLPVKPC